MTVVLNSRSEKPAVTKTAVERALRREVDIEIAFDENRPELAAVAGQILALTNPRSEITRGAEALAARLESVHRRVKKA